jgi:hypothetical protein
MASFQSINIDKLIIPRVFPNISERRIRGVFKALNICTIANIELVSFNTKDGKKFNKVFINIDEWNETGCEITEKTKEKLRKGEEIKIVYEDPWFWKVSAFREQNRARGKTIKRPFKKAYLDIEDDDKDTPAPAPAPASTPPAVQERVQERVQELEDGEESQGVRLNYGNIVMPKKRVLKKAHPVLIKQEQDH